MSVMQETRFDPWVGKIPGEGNGYPLQHSCLENSMDRGTWWVIAHGIAKSQTWLSDWHSHTQQSASLTLVKGDSRLFSCLIFSWCGTELLEITFFFCLFLWAACSSILQPTSYMKLFWDQLIWDPTELDLTDPIELDPTELKSYPSSSYFLILFLYPKFENKIFENRMLHLLLYFFTESSIVLDKQIQ